MCLKQTPKLLLKLNFFTQLTKHDSLQWWWSTFATTLKNLATKKKHTKTIKLYKIFNFNICKHKYQFNSVYQKSSVCYKMKIQEQN